MHTPRVTGTLSFFITLGYMSCMVVVSVSAKEEVQGLSRGRTIKKGNGHLKSHRLLKTPLTYGGKLRVKAQEQEHEEKQEGPQRRNW